MASSMEKVIELTVQVVTAVLYEDDRAPAQKVLKATFRKAAMTLNNEERATVGRRALGTLCLRGRLQYRLDSLRDAGVCFDGDEHAALLVLLYVLFEEPDITATAAFCGERQAWSRQIGQESLRQIELSVPKLQYLPWPTTPIQRLMMEFSLPCWLATLWHNEYTLGDACRLAAAMNRPGGTILRVNPWRARREDVAARLLDEGIVTEPTSRSPWGLCVKHPPKANIWGSTAFREGLYEVQDEGSQLIALATEAKSGEIVVDYCAGRGGKTLALIGMTGTNGRVIAHDVDAHCKPDIEARLRRGGADSVELCYGLGEHVAEHMDQQLLGGRGGDVGCVTPQAGAGINGLDNLLQDIVGADGADVVLVDGPCSSLGTLRRGPNVRWEIDPCCLALFPPLQISILEQAATLVRPGGRLIYSTCTLCRAENEDLASRFTAGKGAQLGFDPWPFDVDGDSDVWCEAQDNEVRLAPHTTGTDGFYIARWRRLVERGDIAAASATEK